MPGASDHVRSKPVSASKQYSVSYHCRGAEVSGEDADSNMQVSSLPSRITSAVRITSAPMLREIGEKIALRTICTRIGIGSRGLLEYTTPPPGERCVCDELPICACQRQPGPEVISSIAPSPS